MSRKPRVIDVFIPRRGGRLWTYKLPQDETFITPGAMVAVPFGKQAQLGMVASEPYEATNTEDLRLRAIHKTLGIQLLPPDLWRTLLWLQRYYLATLGTLLEKLIHLGNWQLKKQPDGSWNAIRTTQSPAPDTFRITHGSNPALRSQQAKSAWQRLETLASFTTSDLQDIYKDPTAIIRKWRNANWIEPVPWDQLQPKAQPVQLSQLQQNVVHDIQQSPDPAHVLYGVTGSGKTEVYIEIAKSVLAQQKTVLVLVPEIALVSGIANRFQERLGQRVDVWHSALAGSVRSEVLQRMVNQQSRILVGARSALFAPLSNIGLIIVDEEHDGSYEMVEGLYMHARDTALQRAKYANARIILGSATPSVSLRYAADKSTSIQLHKLDVRAKQAQLPTITIADMRETSERGPRPWLSSTLSASIDQCLAKDEQVVLFRNRRGFHPIVLCDRCDEALECPNCSVALTLHARPVRMLCHLCGFQTEPLTQCNNCGSKSLSAVGAGTQRLYEELESLYPNATIERLDRDQITSATKLERILNDFGDGSIDILVGTQMVAKGLDIERVTLVGVIDVDGALNQPDYRAAERTYQHLCQVAGRAGRGEHPGKVVIQTRHPDHPVVQAVLAHDYEQYYQYELRQRRLGNYPPYAHLMRMVWSGLDQSAVERIARQATSAAKHQQDIHVVGPAPAPLERVGRRWRWHAVARAQELSKLREWSATIQQHTQGANVRCAMQLNPGSMM